MSLDAWTRGVVGPLAPAQKSLLAGCKALANAREDVDSLLSLVLGESTIDPLSPEGALASYFLHCHCLGDMALALRIFGQVKVWRALVDRCTALITRMMAAPSLQERSRQVRLPSCSLR